MNFPSISLGVETISSTIKVVFPLRFKGFSPTYLGPTPVAEFHGPLGDSR